MSTRKTKWGKHPHLQAEGLLHLLRLLGIKSTLKPLASVAISVAGKCGYYYPGRLMYKGECLTPGVSSGGFVASGFYMPTPKPTKGRTIKK